ncbi:unnamed protein product [Sphagnum jensenii]|uniref:Uncharacterized protein n=1 Tax=Sphagnum jensenii TaxID=128206 RepID=A0ABP0X7D6_9BRYO
MMIGCPLYSSCSKRRWFPGFEDYGFMKLFFFWLWRSLEQTLFFFFCLMSSSSISHHRPDDKAISLPPPPRTV